MDKFTASNGGTIRVEIGGRTTVTDHTRERLSETAETISRTAYLNEAQADALREFYQAKRDEEQGLWRSKAHPGWTAIRKHTVVYFQHEDHERSFHVVVGNKASLNSWSWDLIEVAREYLEAHPEPKPWDSAKPGDVWVLTVPVGERPANVRLDGVMYDEYGNKYAMSSVTAARRIWPESD